MTLNAMADSHFKVQNDLAFKTVCGKSTDVTSEIYSKQKVNQNYFIFTCQAIHSVQMKRQAYFISF